MQIIGLAKLRIPGPDKPRAAKLKQIAETAGDALTAYRHALEGLRMAAKLSGSGSWPERLSVAAFEALARRSIHRDLPGRVKKLMRARVAQAATGELPPGAKNTCDGCGGAFQFTLKCERCRQQRFCSHACLRRHWGARLSAQCREYRGVSV